MTRRPLNLIAIQVCPKSLAPIDEHSHEIIFNIKKSSHD